MNSGAPESKPPRFFEIRTRPFFKRILSVTILLFIVSPVAYLIWAFSDDGTEYFPGNSSDGRANYIVGDELTEVSIPIEISSNLFWQGKSKTLYVNVGSPDKWGNLRESEDVEHCRITLTNHGRRACKIDSNFRGDVAPGETVEIHVGELNQPSFTIYDLKLKASDLEVKCVFSKPLAKNTSINVVASWSRVKF